MFTILDVKNPVYSSIANDAITCDIKIEGQVDYLPFTATAYDVESHGVEIFNQIKDGQWGEIKPFVPPKPPVPSLVTRRQFALQMLNDKLISATEAVAMTGVATPPAIVETAIQGLPAKQQDFARIDFAAVNYERTNATLIGFMKSLGKDDAAIDQFFIDAAAR